VNAVGTAAPSSPESDALSTGPAGIRDAGVVVSATFASRILGYVRDMLIAWSFGAGMYADAFIVAFRIPNLVRRLVGEGALGMAFIPVFHDDARRRGSKHALDLAVMALRRLALLLAVVVFLGILLSPAIVRGLAPGFMVSGDKLQLTVHLTRIMFPYVILVGLVALSMGILNALGHFAAPALAPLALNITMISAVWIGVWLAPTMAVRIGILAAGVVFGGALQLGLQVPVLVRHGVRFWHPPPSESGALGRFGRSALPVLLGGATYQINVLLGTLLASYLAVGSVSYLFYADRLVQFPLGIFAISAVTVMMPGLSRQAAEKRLDDMKQTLSQSLRMVWFVTVPAMVGLIVLREPIVALLFERGAFDSNSTRLTAEALLWYSSGLWAYAALRILLAVFYARQDAYRPLKAAVISMLVNLGAGVLLMRVMGHGGIALAAALSAMVNVMLLGVMLRWQIGPLGGWKIVSAVVRIAGCALLMGYAVHLLNVWLAQGPGRGTALQIGRLLACITTGVVVYVTAAFLCRSKELRLCRQLVRHRKNIP
jgi:putative peptidoglycan lipid II flippase